MAAEQVPTWVAVVGTGIGVQALNAVAGIILKRVRSPESTDEKSAKLLNAVLAENAAHREEGRRLREEIRQVWSALSECEEKHRECEHRTSQMEQRVEKLESRLDPNA